MKIGELVAATGTPADTIRFYEREGLLQPTTRTDGNYRVYGPAHVERLVFIRHCRSLDMALDEVRTLIRLKDAPDEDCAGVNAVLDAHIAHVDERIRELRALQAQLAALRAQCGDPTATGHCGILRELSAEWPEAQEPARVTEHVHGTH